MKPTITLPPFPHAVEKWWWKATKEKWPDWGEEKLLNSLRQEIVAQSDRFNKDRSFEAGSYGSRDLSIFAYGNFYFSRTWMAMNYAVAETFASCKWSAPRKGPIRILDLGSGTGSSGLATLHLLRYFGIKNPIELTAWDYSGKSLSFLKNLKRGCSELWPETKVVTNRCDLRTFANFDQQQKFDLILMGYSFNEIMQDQEISDRDLWLCECSQLLKRSGFLIITEPAEMKICKNLQKSASMLIKRYKSLYIHAPYLNGLNCPMAQKESKFFSHEVRRYRPVQIVEILNRPLRLEIREVKYGFTILSPILPDHQDSDFRTFRIISPIKKRKGTISFLGMGSDGQEYLYEFQRRDLLKEEMDDLLFLERGDIMRLEEGEIIEEKKRVRLNSSLALKEVFVPRLGLSI